MRRRDIGLVTKLVSVVDSEATGELMRKKRKELNLSLRAMAKKMGLSAMYLCDLERGARNWSEQLIEIWWEAANQD